MSVSQKLLPFKENCNIRPFLLEKAARAHRRYEQDEEHHHNATFEHGLTEKLLDAVLSDKIGHHDEHGHEVNLGMFL